MESGYRPATGGISALNAKQPKRINTNIDFSDIKTEPVTIDADEQQSLKRSTDDAEVLKAVKDADAECSKSQE